MEYKIRPEEIDLYYLQTGDCFWKAPHVSDTTMTYEEEKTKSSKN